MSAYATCITEQAYVHWVRAFIRFHGVRHPGNLGQSQRLSEGWRTSARFRSPHRQALAALLFFYGKVLCTDLPWLQEIGRPPPSRRLPVVLTRMKWFASSVFLEGEHRLFAQLLYGTGMRISEGLLCGSRIWFRSRHDHRAGGQGLRDRADVTRNGTQPARAASRARAWWLKDRAEGRSSVALPDALSGVVRRAFLAVVLGFYSTRIRPIHGAVSCVAITCMTRIFQRLQTCRRTSRHHGSPPPHPPPLVRDGLAHAAVTTFEPCRICSAIPTSLRR